MCDLSSDNLIDLSVYEETSSSHANREQLSKGASQFLSPSWRHGISLTNDSIGCVHQQEDRLSDPFDCLENRYCFKAKHPFKKLNDIKLGNLLSLSDGVILDTEQILTNPDVGTINTQKIENDSHPAGFNEKYSDYAGTTDSDTISKSSTEIPASSKLKKNMEHRKNLFKLSIANASFNPSTHQQAQESRCILGTPISSILSEAASFGDQLLSTESPLKFIEDEDIVSEKSQSFKELEKKFEADLEMLKIPILYTLPSSVTESTLKRPAELDVLNKQSASSKTDISNLDTIKIELNTKKSEMNKNKHRKILSVIEHLKSLISLNVMENKKKKQANDLLDELTLAMNTENGEEHKQISNVVSTQPHTIIRQGTFDLDLQEKQVGVGKYKFKDLPSCMISSSSKYGSGQQMEQCDFNVSEISPSFLHGSDNIQLDIHDIVEQLNNLLVNSSTDDQITGNNPTFIVVMNTSQLNNSNIDNCKDDIVCPKLRSAYVANSLENSFNDLPDLTKVNSLQRRRSQSLSIHNKVNIVQLPLHPKSMHLIQNQQSNKMSSTIQIKKTPTTFSKQTPEFKTPTRLRRNSYSSGTPHTAQVRFKRDGFGNDTKIVSQMQKVENLDTRRECQQHAEEVRSNNLPTFKLELKKKVKSDTDSIMKSSIPLKATIPVKRVAPTIKLNSPNPEKNKIYKIMDTMSTPKPTEKAFKLTKGVTSPNACSTPAAFSSSLKCTTEQMNKLRYSYMSTKPNHMTSVIHSSVGSLKRRTLNNFNPKSPLRPRISNVGFPSAASSSTRDAIRNSNLSISAGAQTSRATARPNAKTAAYKPTSHLGSVGDSLLTNKNKENKRF